MKNQYEKQKTKIRDEAIQWQHDFENQNYSYGELVEWQTYFEKMGKRYGLLKEFRENAII